MFVSKQLRKHAKLPNAHGNFASKRQEASKRRCNKIKLLSLSFVSKLISQKILIKDLLITLENKCIYILELTVGFESNLLTNATRKRQKYEELINEQHKYYEKVKFVNLSISSLGVFSH